MNNTKIWSAAAVAQIADIATTRVGLLVGAHEKHPVAQGAGTGEMLMLKGVFLMLIMAMYAGISRSTAENPWAVPAAAVGHGIGISVWNSVVIMAVIT